MPVLNRLLYYNRILIIVLCVCIIVNDCSPVLPNFDIWSDNENDQQLSSNITKLVNNSTRKSKGLLFFFLFIINLPHLYRKIID